MIDDNTGYDAGLPLPDRIVRGIAAAGLPPIVPPRGLNGLSGNGNTPGTLTANVEQQRWFAAVAANVVLPDFRRRGRPFVMVYWSRDPDGSQHGQGDSLGQLVPGINGPTSLAAIRNADDNLAALERALAQQGLADTTDIIVTSDHGFSVISKNGRDPGDGRGGAAAARLCRAGPGGRAEAARVRPGCGERGGAAARPHDARQLGAGRPRAPAGSGGGERRVGPRLPADRRQGPGRARRRGTAGARLHQRSVRRRPAGRRPRHAAAQRHRPGRRGGDAAARDRGRLPHLRDGRRLRGGDQLPGRDRRQRRCSRARGCTAASGAATR